MKLKMALLVTLFPALFLIGCGKDLTASNTYSDGGYESTIHNYKFERHQVQWDAPISPAEGQADEAYVKSLFNFYSDEFGNRYYISKNPSMKRALWFPGLMQDAENYLGFPHNVIIKSMLAAGYQIVLTNNPDYSVDPQMTIRNNGADYNQIFQEKIGQKMAFIDKTIGHSDNWTFGGTSFGGYHALLATCLYPINHTVLAKISVIEPSEIFPPLLDYRAEGIMSSKCIGIFKTKKVILSYGTLDDRALPGPIQDIANRINTSNEYVFEYVGLNHTSTVQTDNLNFNALMHE